MSMEDWVDDVNSTDDDDEDAGGSSLFEDNFRRMVENGEVDSLNAQTVQNQIEQITDKELLAEATTVDDRDDCVDAYQERLGELNGEAIEAKKDEEEAEEAEVDDDPEPEESAEPTDEETDEDEEEEEEEADDEPADPDDILDEVTDDEPDEEDEEEVDAEAEETVDSPVVEETETTEVDDTEADSDLPDVNIGALAPSAQTREAVANAPTEHTLLVWGPEGSGKSHVAHSAPEPICYIDTEGKADELASKFDKEIVYFTPDDYKEAKDALEQSLDVLAKYREHGVTGTIVVDSMTVMWEWAKIDYAKFAYQTDDLTDVTFRSELEGEQDWAKIKARHNDQFREVILDSPYHAVFTSGQKEDYNAVMSGASGKPMTDDGEKRNRYAVKDVVRVRVNDEGNTVADLRKAAATKYSFVGLEWPEWNDIYDAIGQIADAEQAPEPVDVTQWPFDVVEGQPVTEGTDDDGGEDGN